MPVVTNRGFRHCSGRFGFGLKAGVPLTDFTNAVSNGAFNYTSKTQRYIVGPTVELRLPGGFGIEVDALYRRFSYNGSITGAGITSSTSGNAWEFPILAKYRFPTPDRAAVYRRRCRLGQPAGAEAGRAARRLANAGITSTSTPAELNKKTTTGFVLGFGVDVHALILSISRPRSAIRGGARSISSTRTAASTAVRTRPSFWSESPFSGF